MGIMNKVAPIALVLGLTARALFGNPLESTLVKEDNNQFEVGGFTGSVDNTGFNFNWEIPQDNDWSFNLASDIQYLDTLKINSIDLTLGRENFYWGLSYENLSNETSLKDSNLFKAQLGIRPADWIDFSLTGAGVTLPNYITDLTANGYGKFNTPFTLYAAGWNLNIGKEFELNYPQTLFPWFSTTGSIYFADPALTNDYWTLNQATGYDSAIMAYPFDHLNVQTGLDFRTEYLDLLYQGTFEGHAYIPSPFNFSNMIGIRLHDEDRKTFNLEYDVSLITKPSFALDEFFASTRNELQFDVKAFALLPKSEVYVKGQVSAIVNFLTQNQFNVTAAIGKKFNWGNLELYFNSQCNPEDFSQNNTFGIQYSKQLDKSLENESRTRNAFATSSGVPNPNISDYYINPTKEILHQTFGNTLEDAVSNIHSEQDLSKLAALITYQEHGDSTFSAQDEYEKYGYGACGDTNGNLLPYLEKAAFDYKNVYAAGLRGPGISHAVVIIETKDNKFDLRNYDQFYSLNAPSAEAAIQTVYPGASAFSDGTVSTAVTVVTTAVERSLNHNWQKYRN